MAIIISPQIDKAGSASSALLSYEVPTRWLMAILAAYFSFSQILLWRFLNIAPVWGYWLGISGSVALSFAIFRAMRPAQFVKINNPTIRTLLICFIVAFVLFLLGGEGRFFYANIDWQVRNAVLRDIGINPWPFVYTARAVPDVLRAPIGMFLVPGLAIKAFGLRAGDIVLLVQNSAILAVIFGLSAQLFADATRRALALLIFLAFSGLDIWGRFLIHQSLTDHIESWADIQYSSNITLAFWVPQHALAGWTGALSFLLWRAGRLPLAVFLTVVPLTALWSPFAVLGSMPFVALASVTTLRKQAIKPWDIVLPAFACVLCLPCFLYLTAAGADVGLRFYTVEWMRYLIFQIVETAPYLIPLAIVTFHNKGSSATLISLTICLLLIPFIQIGWSIDFMMRASIPALAILAMTVADVIVTDAEPHNRFARRWLIAALAIGSATGLFEIRRAFQHPPAPLVTCSFFKAWDQSFHIFPKGSYLAPLPDIPAMVKPAHPAMISAAEPRQCWQGNWYRPSGV